MAQAIPKMETTQTAVDYLIEMIRLNNKEFYAMLFEDGVIEQAKAMEKEQMKGMYVEGGFAQMRYFDGKEFITGEQYYNETYAK